MQIELIAQNEFLIFWLCFARLLGILMQFPLFEQTVPMNVKILTTVILNYCFFDHNSQYLMTDWKLYGEDLFFILLAFQVLVGLGLGLMLKSILNIYISAGVLITQSLGFSFMRYFDLSIDQSVGPFEKLLKWIVLMFIIMSGAIVPIFKGILFSFRKIQMNSFTEIGPITDFFTGFFKQIFLASLHLASPLIIGNLLIMVILGITARTVPQMNILMVSFVVNIGIGLLIFLYTLDEFFVYASDVYKQLLGRWFNFIVI